MSVSDQVVQGAKYMIVGEAPGAEEERAGKPFVGMAGGQLDKMLRTAGINREECWITNVVSERPAKNNFGVYYYDSQRNKPKPELEEAWGELRNKVTLAGAKVVICLGGEAMKGVLGLSGIEARRGSVYKVGRSLVVPTFHPSAVLRGGVTGAWYLPASVMDFRKAVRVAGVEGFEPLNPVVKLVSSPEEIDAYLGEDCGREVAFDIETTMQGGEGIRCIGFCAEDLKARVVPIEQLTFNTQLRFLSVFKKWMESGQVRWVAQNGQFDINMIKRLWNISLEGFYFDTMVAHHVLMPEFPHSLATLTSIYTDIPYYKDTSSSNLYRYNGLDAVSTYLVSQAELCELSQRGLEGYYFQYAHRLFKPLREMALRGIKVDEEYQRGFKNELKKEIGALQRELDKTFEAHSGRVDYRLRLQRLSALKEGGRKTVKLPTKEGKFVRRRVESLIKGIKERVKKESSLNVRSKPQLEKFLYSTLKLPKQTKMGKVTTDETALNKLYIKTSHPFLKTITKLRQVLKEYSDYGLMKADEDGRVRTTYKFVETGRLSSGKFEAK